MAAIAQENFPRRRPGTVDQPFQLDGSDHVGIQAVTVLRNPLRIEEFEARGDDDVANLDLDLFLLLLEVNGVAVGARFQAGLLALARPDLQAALGVNQHHLRHRLGEGDVDGLALAQAHVEFVRELPLFEHAGLDALQAAHAQVLLDIAGLALDRDGVIADVAFDLRHLRVSPQRDVLVRPHGGHLGRENAGGAIQRRKSLVELGHVPADARFPFDQENFLASVGHRQGRVNARNASAHHQHVGVNGNARRLQRPMKTNPPHRRVRERHGFGRGFRAVGMHPRIVLADVDHLEIKRVQSARRHRVAEGVLVQQGRAGGHHHAVELVLADVLLDQFLPRLRAHVLVVARNRHAGKFADILGHGRAIHHAGNVVPAVADVEADANVAVAVVGVHTAAGWAGNAFMGIKFRFSPSCCGDSPKASPINCVK